MDFNTLHQAFLAHMRQHGREKAWALIEKVGKAKTLDQVAEKDRPALLAAFQKDTTPAARAFDQKSCDDWAGIQRRAFERFNRQRRR